MSNEHTVHCSKCLEEKSYFGVTEVQITQKTGEVRYGRRDVHPSGTVTGRVESRQFRYEPTVRIQMRLCADCLWTAKQNARRSNGNIVIREI